MNAAPHVLELRQLLGDDVLLLPWPLGKKGDKRCWKHLTAEAMNEPAHLLKLAAGNIGVALGRVSGNLCSLDIDNDEEMAAFLALNPSIGNTLYSQGSRGGNLWWRIDGGYPPLTPLKRHGKAWGEWRSTGAQTIVYGQHPDGNHYRILNRVRPLRIQMAQIRWPNGISPLLSEVTLEDDTESTECTERTERTEVDRSGNGIVQSVCSSADLKLAVESSLPNRLHENHKCLFNLARTVKALELQVARKWPMDKRKELFMHWYERAKPFLNPSQSQDDYWFEFLEAYDNANHPFGVNVITDAWDAANSKEPPDVARQFDSDQIRLLVSFCRELQVLCGDRSFFLASRTVKRLFELDSHVTGARWLKGLCRTGILKVVEQGGRETNKATRFRYLPPL
jgi:hypothetical protein